MVQYVTSRDNLIFDHKDEQHKWAVRKPDQSGYEGGKRQTTKLGPGTKKRCLFTKSGTMLHVYVTHIKTYDVHKYSLKCINMFKWLKCVHFID